jgi:hypothetical protein
MDKEVEVEVVDENAIGVYFKNDAMAEYFKQWWDEVGSESFQASIVDITE